MFSDGWNGRDGTCYIDGKNRILTKKLQALSDNTPSKCKSECSKLYYSLAGVQYGTECFCGNELAGHAKIASSNDCNMRCPGDKTFFCGAGHRMNVYSTKEPEGEIGSLSIKSVQMLNTSWESGNVQDVVH